jgi:hypothetical protein
MSTLEVFAAASSADQLRIQQILQKDNNALTKKNEEGWNAMHFACEVEVAFGNINFFEYLLNNYTGDFNTKVSTGETALHLLLKQETFQLPLHKASLLSLLAKCKKVHCLTKERRTPFHYATLYHSSNPSTKIKRSKLKDVIRSPRPEEEVLELLDLMFSHFEQGDQRPIKRVLNRTDIYGNTVLDYAHPAHLEVRKVLIERGKVI